MKYLLHTLWLGTPRYPLGDGLFVWAENTLPAKRGRAAGMVSPSPRALPFTRLDALLNGLGLPVPGPDFRHKEQLILPTADGRILTSVECITNPPSDEVDLEPWQVSGYRVPVDYISVLASAYARARGCESDSDGGLAPTASFWLAAGRLVSRMANRQDFVPELLTEGPEGDQWVRGRWSPMYGSDTSQVLRALERDIPAVCRLSCSATRPTSDFVSSCLNALVRGRMARTKYDACAGLQYSDYETFMRLFTGPQGMGLHLWHASIAKRAQPIMDWIGGLSPSGSAGPKLCLRLEPLVGGEAPIEADDMLDAFAWGPQGPQAPEGWRLAFLVQSAEDPSLLVPLDAFIRDPEGAGIPVDIHGRPGDELLSALRRAASACRAVATSVLEGRLDGADIAPEEASEFLGVTAPHLRELGFTVLVPSMAHLTARLQFQALPRKPKDASTEAGPSGRSWFSQEGLVKYDWEMALGGERMTRDELMRISEMKSSIVRFRGQWIEVNAAEMDSGVQLLSRGRRRPTPADALRMALTAEELPVEIANIQFEPPSMADWLKDALERLKEFKGSPDTPTPAGFSGSLREYQKAGVSWLGFMREMGLGACLADDMGLGKTIELTAHILAQASSGTLMGPVLLVCPTSVVGNWERELARFAPSLRVLVHHGQSRLSGQEFALIVAGYDVVICPFSLLSRDADEVNSITWDTIALDEAQNIKNPSSKQAQAARQIPALHRVAMTGTPVENHLRELWSIFAFLNPGLLGSSEEFRERYEVPIERKGDEKATASLRAIAGPFILRRVKTDPRVISDLPAKLESKVFCNLTKEQATLYQAVVTDMLDKVEKSSALERRGLILSTLTMLKQVCNHPVHFLKDGQALARRSGKMERLVELMEELLSEGDRALIFTQYAEMGHILKRHLDALFDLDIPFLYGAVDRSARDAMVRTFQAKEGAPVLLLSLKAGGTGLNLTAANHVFHYDRWWNPAVEDQATDRAFRIGQTRTVMVHKLVCAGTLEERIDAMIEGKRALAGQIVTSAESLLTEMTTGELAGMLSLRLNDVGDY